jgi:hypothetical protein
MVIKYTEQTKNCEATRKYSVPWGKHMKVEARETGNLPITRICEYHFLFGLKDRIERQFCSISLDCMRDRSSITAKGGVYK